MSFEGMGEALDSVPEVVEIDETPYSEPSNQLSEEIPEVPEVFEVPYDASVESIKGPEDVEGIIDGERSKAGGVLGFTQEAVETAEKAVGSPNLFKEEKKELRALRGMLGKLSGEDDTPILENTSTQPLEGSQFGREGKISLTTTPAEELRQGVETIAPIIDYEAEHQQNRAVNVRGAEITGLNGREEAAVDRAAYVVYFSGERARSLGELRGLIEQFEILNAREFPDDTEFDKAVGVFMQESKYLRVNTPLIIENGAVDLATGKETQIEILSSEEEQNSVERPIPEQLKQADKDLLETSHGRITDMLAYLKDYEAVASGKMEPYHACMSKKRFMELKRKSRFEETAGIRADNTSEVVRGHGLTWGDTADLYESEGASMAAEQIRSTGRFEISETVTGDYVVGEQHLRLVNIPEYQQRFEALLGKLKSGDFIIVEHPSDSKRNMWTASSSETRFMQQAEKYPNESNKIGLEIMDGAAGPKWDVWERSQQELGVSREDFFYVDGLLHAAIGISAEGGIGKLIADIQSNKDLTESDKRASLRGVQNFMQILILDPEQSKQRIPDITHFWSLYLRLNSTCRERIYQERVVSIKTANPEANLLIVVGDAHRKGLAEAIENAEFRTKFDQATITEFQDLVEKSK